MKKVVMRCEGFASSDNCPILGQYLKTFDFEDDGGIGFGEFTADPSDALKFDSMQEAMEFWRRQSRTKPLRLDGGPNRPLTCMHASFEWVTT